MKIAARFSSCFLLFSVLAASTACNGEVLDVGTAPAPLSENRASVNASAEFNEQIYGLAVDATHVYVSGDGNVYAVPKDGGARVTLVADAADVSTPKTSVAVDDSYVYFSNLQWRRLGRVPKAGGPVEIIADNLGSPRNMVLDATHVYFSVEENFLGRATGPAIVRVPKAGGPVELVATNQPYLTSLLLHGEDVYFAGGYGTPDGSLRRVPKKGGQVRTLAAIDTRSLSLDVSPEVSSLAMFGDKLAFVQPATGKLAFVPAEGGAIETTSLTAEPGGVVVDGSTLVVAALDQAARSGSLFRVDAHGTSGTTLAQWVYDVPSQNEMAHISASAAMTLDASGVYWVDFDNHTSSTTKPIVAKLRSAKLR